VYSSQCQQCKGTGSKQGEILQCSSCGGHGYAEMYYQKSKFGRFLHNFVGIIVCKECLGYGKSSNYLILIGEFSVEKCHSCDSTGLIKKKYAFGTIYRDNLVINISRFTSSGKKIRLAKKGHAGQNGQVGDAEVGTFIALILL